LDFRHYPGNSKQSKSIIPVRLSDVLPVWIRNSAQPLSTTPTLTRQPSFKKEGVYTDATLWNSFTGS
jgi:hypothetical protein